MLVVALAVGVMAPEALAEHKVKTVALNRAYLEAGTTWWCWTNSVNGGCWRARETCEKLQVTCAEQKTAFATSLRLRDRDPRTHLGTFDTEPEVYDSKAHCETARADYIADAKPKRPEDSELVGIAACTAVGPKAPPPLKPLPPGNGFWCIAYSLNGAKRGSICGRRKKECERVQDSIDSGLLGRTFRVRVQTSSECASQKKGWAFIVSDARTREYSDVFIDQETCEAARFEGEPCIEVK